MEIQDILVAKCPGTLDRGFLLLPDIVPFVHHQSELRLPLKGKESNLTAYIKTFEESKY